MSAYQATLPASSARSPLMTTYRPPSVRRTDWINPAVMLALATIGVFFIKSAQAHYPGGTQWEQQMVWLALGAGLYIAIAVFDYHLWMKHAWLVYLGSIGLLLLLWTPLGAAGLERTGARRWLGIGSYTIQPSEFAKIGTIVMLSFYLDKWKLGGLRASLAMLGKLGVIVGIPMVLIFLQPDLGSSLALCPTVFALLYVSNLSARFFVTVFLLFVAGAFILGADINRYEVFLNANQLTPQQDHDQHESGLYAKTSWLPLKDYQRDRIASFLDPGAVDPQGIGVTWNQKQSLIAVGTGGLTGKGYEQGTQARLGYLPSKVATSDFIMAVFLEETGFVGGLAVIGLYAILLGNTLRIAWLARDRFGQLLCVGVAVLFMVHVFVNIGMVQGLMPVKGIPLPLLSYGGSFVLGCCILMGLVQSVYRHCREAV
jgi:rod shape determining protein RodA